MPRPSMLEACTKIVATVGPSCSSQEQLAKLIREGADVFRINTAHGTRQEHEEVLNNIRRAAQETKFPVGVLLDLAGPKIRLGTLQCDPLTCSVGMNLSFIRGHQGENETELTSTYEQLVDELEVGDRVLLADGSVALRVESNDGTRVECVVTVAGTIRSRQGINLPGVKLSVSAMLPRDIDNAIWAAKNEIDLISLSFVRSAEDVKQLKHLLVEHGSQALVIAKIEKPEALEHLDEIVDESDGVMVARGDLGVEIDVAETPIAQKRIIRVCKQKLKPVIVATQMLESMHQSARPTRAEVSDVANAILDGADACMLSGETAIGAHPYKAVETMNRIMFCTERDLIEYSPHSTVPTNRVHPITSAVTHAATNIAEAISAKLIVIATRSGNTAWIKSASRSRIPSIGVSDSEATLRRINLLWGIKPIHADNFGKGAEFIDEICRWGVDHANLQHGDRVVFVTGTGVIDKAHNEILVHTVGD
ncbi:MAG: pyruvate kinase [Rubripirellula sp.]